MIAQPKPLPTTDAPQEGFVLIVGLVILGLLTMLALSSMRDTPMQEKRAGASRDSGLAFQAAESALRDAENCITGTTANCAFMLPPTMRILTKTMPPSQSTTPYLMPPPGSPMTRRGIQPTLREFPPKRKAIPRTGSITSSARQARSLATRATCS